MAVEFKRRFNLSDGRYSEADVPCVIVSDDADPSRYVVVPEAEFRADETAFALTFVDLETLRASRLLENEQLANAERIKVAGTEDATKLAVYREKYATALRALDGDAAALATLEPEATARNETPEALAALVKSLGDRWIALGLQIDAAYQNNKAALLAAATAKEINAIDLAQRYSAVAIGP